MERRSRFTESTVQKCISTKKFFINTKICKLFNVTALYTFIYNGYTK